MATRWDILSGMLKDAGEKRESTAVPIKAEKESKSYPTMYVNEKEVPSLKGLKMGNKIRLVATGEITGTSQHNDNPMSFDIKLKKIAIEKGGE